jgi:tetratricopeptide (TPR) repeat protein
MRELSTGGYYFLPYNADPAAIKRTMLPESELRDTLTAIPGKVLLFLDSCHSGMAGTLFAPTLSTGAQLVLEPRLNRDTPSHSSLAKLFLEELIRAAAEGQLNQNPATVVAMLQARIGHLPAGARRAILAASVYGQTMPLDGVAKLLRLPAGSPEVEQWMRVLIDSEMLEAHGRNATERREYGFRHALVRDAAYGLLTESDQRLGHQLAAEFLEDQRDPQVPVAIVAYHHRRAGLYGKAVEQYVQAGDLASKLQLLEEARRHYVAAEETILMLPRSAPICRLHADILIKQVQCSILVAPMTASLQRIADARALVEFLVQDGFAVNEDRLRLARLDYYSGRIYNNASQPSEAVLFFNRALPVAREFQDAELTLVPTVYFGIALASQGQMSQALALLEPAVAPLERLLGRDVITMRSYLYLAQMQALAGRGTKAAHLIEHVRSWPKEINLPFYSAAYHVQCGLVRYMMGDWAGASGDAEKAIIIGEQLDEPAIQYLSWDCLSMAQCQLGHVQAALEHRQRALELRRPFGGGIAKDIMAAMHAHTLLKAERAAAAAELAQEVTRASRQDRSMWSLAIAERVWGCALVALGASVVKSEEHLRESLAAADQNSLLVEVIWTELAWGQVCRKRGDPLGAAAHFQQAQARITAETSEFIVREILQIAKELTDSSA